MAHRVKIIQGKAPSGGTGGVTDADWSEIAVDFFSKGIVTPTAYLVEQQSTPNMTVKVNTGVAYIPNSTGSMLYATELDASANVTIGANASGNPRIDAIVIKVDTTTTPNNFANNIVSLVAVQGTPAASPSAPSDSAIQTAVGAGNAFYRLANVTVANGASSITNANISSTRDSVILRVTGGYLKYNLTTSKLQFSHDGSSYSDIGANSFIGARVYNSANITLPNNTLTALTFNSERFDTDSMHSISVNTSRITINTAGKYLVTGNVSFTGNATGFRIAAIVLNGSSIVAFAQNPANSASAVTVMTVSQIVDLAAGDYLELQAQQNSGGSLDVIAAAAYSPELSVARLG